MLFILFSFLLILLLYTFIRSIIFFICLFRVSFYLLFRFSLLRAHPLRELLLPKRPSLLGQKSKLRKLYTWVCTSLKEIRKRGRRFRGNSEKDVKRTTVATRNKARFVHPTSCIVRPIPDIWLKKILNTIMRYLRRWKRKKILNTRRVHEKDQERESSP